MLAMVEVTDQDRAPRPSIVFVAGWERSGSTLLGRILGAPHGAFDAGEFTQIWNRRRKSDACGCGSPLESCSFWSAVMPSLPQDGRLEELRDRFTSLRRTWPILLGITTPRQREMLGHFSKLLGDAYRIVASRAQAGLVVDSSKSPSLAPVLDMHVDVDVTFVHLVRDPRAVAYSGISNRYPSMRRGVLQNMSRWVLWNLAIEIFRRRSRNPWIRVRYEDLVSDPAETIGSLAELVPVLRDPELLSQLRNGTVILEDSHTLHGNPSRFTMGPVPIRPDTEWVSALGTGRWLLATVLTSAMLPRYGYHLTRKSSLASMPRHETT